MEQDPRSNGSAKAMEREIAARALEHDCPTCGAKAGIRCRILTPKVTNPKRTKVDVRAKPCAERATLGWRAMLKEQEPPSTSTAVAARSQKPRAGFSLATVDLDDLYRAAVLNVKGQRPFGGVINRAELDQLADATAAAGITLYAVAFYIASKVYVPLSGWGDPSRREAMDLLKDRADLSASMARRACDTVDIVATVTIDEEGVGTPSLRQLNTIARADIRKLYNGSGWARVNGWIIKKGGWGNVTEAAIADYCERIKAEAKADERDREPLLSAEDPHAPADVQVIDCDDDAGEVVDAELVGPAPRPLNTPEQQEAARTARAADLFKTVAVDGSRLLAAMEDFDPTHPWVQENISDWRRAVAAVDQAKALIDDATKLRAV